MKYNLNKLQTELLGYTLDSEQIAAIQSVIQFIEYPLSFTCCIEGRAGTGKTQLAKVITAILSDNNIPYLVVSPTNKSKNVIASVTNTAAITIHTLLSLQPDMNIINLDLKDLKFIQKQTLTYKKHAIWIIDECSMINDTIYSLILELAKKHYCKIIFIGDSKQLAPIKQSHISRTFTNSDIYLSLENVHRQDYLNVSGQLTLMGRVLEYLRNKPLYTFKQSISPTDHSLYVYNNLGQFLLSNIDVFQDAMNLEDPNLIKLISYTNNRVTAINKTIRSLLFPDTYKTTPYHIGEILTGFDTFEYQDNKNVANRAQIENSVDYIVRDCTPICKKLHKSLPISFDGWRLHLFDLLSQSTKTIFMIDPSDQAKMFQLSNSIELARLHAIDTNKPSDWQQYYSLINSFATPIDFTVQSRIIKRKTLDYGYCITVHKSQASQYDVTLVDMENILLCQNEQELRQLQYVALSRAQGDVYLYKR